MNSPIQSQAVPQPGQVFLITGPARSGKSEWAEQLAERSLGTAIHRVIYVATALANPADEEWMARIQAHRCRRPGHWHLREVPQQLTDCLTDSTPTDCLLIDSLGTWVANGIEWDEARWQDLAQSFIAALQDCPALVILVAEETGWGVVPAYALGRRFRDRLGLLSRAISYQADGVYLATAGYVLPLHRLGHRLDSTPI